MNTYEIFYVDSRGHKLTVTVQAEGRKEARRASRTQTKGSGLVMVAGPTKSFKTA